jgi:D-arabinose 1-dehydrogenase-like Zn-dependent alcohol dehydrogenase
VYSPLQRNGCGPGAKVGVVGVGGLGHLAVMFARAMGAEEVWAFMLDHSLDADARELGATGVIVMSDEGVQEQHRHTLFVPFFSLLPVFSCFGMLQNASVQDPQQVTNSSTKATSF